jgi:lipopolysaccharide transport system ATP-binding protein
MSQIAIKVENLSKIYRLGEIGTGSIGQDVDRWFKTKILGKEDPFLKIGESNDRSTKGMSDFVYSLQDINFEINQGDAVGIIGRNGAGKSTLLKILSRVTTPTTGKINIKGRVASLLEVGTGFHPELTGRENIYLNGAILGMRKREIDRKLDEIIDFSGVERYIDTPVKRYSSGMYVRLAFAVAAHLESEILIVDEVLAVGDAEFQKKCLGKMQDVNGNEGRTVLFVSHNLGSVLTLTKKGILINQGNIEKSGEIHDVLNHYARFTDTIKKEIIEVKNIDNRINISKVLVNHLNSNHLDISYNDNLSIEIFGFCNEEIILNVEARLYDLNQFPLAFFSDGHYTGNNMRIQAGEFTLSCVIELPQMINKGMFQLEILWTDPGKTIYGKIMNNVILNYEGVSCLTGHKFEQKNAGFILMKGITNYVS